MQVTQKVAAEVSRLFFGASRNGQSTHRGQGLEKVRDNHLGSPSIDLIALAKCRLSSFSISGRDRSKIGVSPDDDEGQAALETAEPQPVDTSNPDALFKVSHQRLLDEAMRINAISVRNLVIGILFSSIALAVLAWPIVSAALLPRTRAATTLLGYPRHLLRATVFGRAAAATCRLFLSTPVCRQRTRPQAQQE